MDARNNNWLDSHCTHRYPLDDNATGIGDNGIELKDDILADLHIRWPAAAGNYAFISGIMISPTLVTVVIVACDSPTVATRFTPLAAVSIPKPVTELTYYPLIPLSAGVGGFVAFGDLESPFAIRMSTPQQGLLSPRVAAPYDPLPIPSIRKHGRHDALTNIVKLVAGTDIEIINDTVTIGDQQFDAIVIQLQAATTGRDPLATYIGPCGKRPESQNCDSPGIQTINGVGPDCTGNIELQFEGLLTGPYNECGNPQAGVTLDQNFGIADVCPDRAVQFFTGDDYCNPTMLSSVSLSHGGDGGGGGGDVGGSSESLGSVDCTELPFVDDFDTSLNASWVLLQGNRQLVEADSPEEELAVGHSLPTVQALQLNSTTSRNILLWKDCGTGDAGSKLVRTHLQMLTGGPQQNAGIMMNYRLVNPLTNPQIRYFLAQLNINTNRIELLSYNGTATIVENSVIPPVPLVVAHWYELTVTVTNNPPGRLINVNVRDVTDPDWPTVSFQISTNRWGTSTGHYGVHTSQAVSNFSFWSIADA